MAESYRPTKGMQSAARRALEWIKDGKAGSGFTDVGRKRASDIAGGRSLSAQTVLRMYSFFARHEVDKKATGFNSGEEGFPTPGRVAWDAWGGDAGYSWSTKIRNQLQKSVRALEMMASEEDEMEYEASIPDLVEELQETLADVVSFYLRAHGAHWNVTGTDFAEYHELFGKIYDDANGSIDAFGENIRKLGSKAPFRLADFIEMRTIPDSDINSQDARVLATDLLSANDGLIESLAYAFKCADELNQQGIANFLAERLDAHQNWKWQLSASLGVEAQGEDLNMEPAEEIDEPSAEDMPSQEPMMEDSSIRAAAGDVKVGTFVSWSSSGGKAQGKVEQIVTDGTAKSSEGFEIEGTKDEPAIVIRIYKEGEDGWDATDMTVVHRLDTLSVIGALRKADILEANPMIEERKAAIATAERITMSTEVRAMDSGDAMMRIGGYAATFNNEATGLNFREVIAPGAFTTALVGDEPVFLLVNHDTDGIPLASTKSGTLRLSQDEVGLRFEADLDPSNPKAQELASAIRRGDMTKMSFAFTVNPDGQTKEDGLRTITQFEKIYEVSAVTWPAYDATDLGMRSKQADDIALRARLLKAKIKNSRLR